MHSTTELNRLEYLEAVSKQFAHVGDYFHEQAKKISDIQEPQKINDVFMIYHLVRARNNVASKIDYLIDIHEEIDRILTIYGKKHAVNAINENLANVIESNKSI